MSQTDDRTDELIKLMIMYYIDMDYLDLESRMICGFLDYNISDVEENGFETLQDAIGEIKYLIDEGFRIDGIVIYSIYDGMEDFPNKPCYKIARCSEEQGERFGIVADEFYGEFIEEDDEEDFECEPF